MSTQGDLVQIVIPCFNGEEFLRETLFSIQNQTYANFDCLMIDDGSEDDSLKIFGDFSQSDPRFRAMQNSENRGESYSVNRGWANKRGNLVSILSCDDPQPDDWLEEMYLFYKSHAKNNFVVYYPNRVVINQSGDFVRREMLLEWSESSLIDDLLCVASVGALIDTSLLPNDFEPRIEEVRFPSDLIQYLKIVEFGSGIRHPNFFCVWREHLGGKSADDRTRLAQEFVLGMSIYIKSKTFGSNKIGETSVFAHTVGILRKEFRLPGAIGIGMKIYLTQFSIKSLNLFSLLKIVARYLRRSKNKEKSFNP